MSMLSAQMDELRELATRYDELQVGAVKAVKIPSNMGSILRDAADTIWQLRDDLQRAHRENAKLMELARDMFGGYKGSVEMLPSSYSKNVAEMAVMDISDRMRELGVEVE